MGDKTLFVNRWGRDYRCYNSMIKHLKLSTREIFMFKKAVHQGKIRFFKEVPHVDDFEHRFFHVGDVRKVIDAYRTRKKANEVPKQKKVGKKKQKRIWIKNRQNKILEDMLKKQEEAIAKSSLEVHVEEQEEEVKEVKIIEEKEVKIIEDKENWLGVYEKLFLGESCSEEMISFY